MKRKSNKKYFIVLLLIAVLLLAVGYAAFSDQLNITGSASANGKFDIQFTRANKIEAKGVKDESAVICNKSDDGKTLTVAVPEMQYPGAGARFEVTIENKGTVPAKVTGLIAKVDGKDVTSDLKNENIGERPEAAIGTEHIKIAGLGIFDDKTHTEKLGSNAYLQPNTTCNFTFSVYWDENSEGELTDKEKEGISFDLQIDYEQASGDKIAFPDINDHHDTTENDNFGANETWYVWNDPRYVENGGIFTPEEIYALEQKGWYPQEDGRVTKNMDGTGEVLENWKELINGTTGGVGIDSGFDGEFNVPVN